MSFERFMLDTALAYGRKQEEEIRALSNAYTRAAREKEELRDKLNAISRFSGDRREAEADKHTEARDYCGNGNGTH